MKNFTLDITKNFKSIFGFVILLMILNTPCFAQYGGCVDTTTILAGSVCDTDNVMNYKPVCGCDNNTYFNICVAQTLHGVSTYQDGPCQTTGLGFVLWPNPVNYSPLNMILAVFDPSDNVHVTIYSVANFQFCFENYYTLANYTSNLEFLFPIDVSLFPRGEYILIAQSSLGSQHAVQKFIVQPLP
jgi:hypothetical protein